jgi:hypothetical protein
LCLIVLYNICLKQLSLPHIFSELAFEMQTEFYVRLHVKCPWLLSDCKSRKSKEISVKLPNLTVHETPHSSAPAVTGGQTDMTKLIFAMFSGVRTEKHNLFAGSAVGFWLHLMRCRLIGRESRFGGTYWLHLQCISDDGNGTFLQSVSTLCARLNGV